jgi:predicted ABC-type ATPase
MPSDSPHLIVLAGPNGAGKSTEAPSILRGTLDIAEFVNADLIAQGLSPFDPEHAAIPRRTDHAGATARPCRLAGKFRI